MLPENHPRNDQRSIDELLEVALVEIDEDIRWNAVQTLQWRGNNEVLERAVGLCSNSSPQKRCLGADILGQLGLPDRTFPTESSRKLRGLLKPDEDAAVLHSALVGLSHLSDQDAIPSIVPFSTHPDLKVRHAVVLALSGYENPMAIECLIHLSNDSDELVRDWATFALGTQIDLDTPEVRNALMSRIDDPDDDTRGEALVGLARRKDERVIPAIKKELESDCIGKLAIEAAELIGSDQLQTSLIALRNWWDIDPKLLEQAITASQP